MTNPENYNTNDYETVALRGELADLFRSYSEIVAFQIPDDMTQPTSVVLVGNYWDSAGNEEPASVQIWQRQNKKETEYLIIAEETGGNYWYRISDNEAYQIYVREDVQLTSKVAAVVRWCIRPETANYSNEESSKIASEYNPFDRVETMRKNRQSSTEDSY